MYKLIISSLVVCTAMCAYADEVKDKEVASDETVVSSDEAGELYRDFGCGSCGGKTKK